MEYLRAIFHEELDTDGEIVVAGETFTRHQILSGLAPVPYKIAFDEWLEQREIRMIEVADEILAKFDNSNRFDKLKRAFNKGNMKPFVGAGLSISSGYPGWTEFLYQLCEESHFSKNALTKLLNEGRYEEAAEEINTDLGAELFNENVEVTYGRPCMPYGVVNYLPRVFPDASVLTTNFDTLLEELYRGGVKQGFDRVISGKAIGEVARQMANGHRMLIKLHGHCNQVAERVLLKSEYDAVYGDVATVEHFFNHVIFGGSLLFLGCSLCVDRTIFMMRKVVEKIGGDKLPHHYAFMELKADEDRIQRKKELAKANIFPIWYKDVDHDEALEALFLKLLEAE